MSPENISRKPGHEALLTRHSIAQYIANDEALISDDPSVFFDIENQPSPDLTPEGVDFARQEAEKLLATLDPAKDKLFFVSSALARALETAAIYAQVAKEKCFMVIKPRQSGPGSELGAAAQRISGKEVRAVRSLTVRPYNPLATMIFSPDNDNRLQRINWNAVDPILKEKWEQAHTFVTAGGKESWNANFVAYSEQIAQRFPEFGIESARHLFERQFKNIVRLAAFGIRKAQKTDPNGSIKILAFGHDNYLGYALNEYFQDHDIKNCETITLATDDTGAVHMERRGARLPIGDI